VGRRPLPDAFRRGCVIYFGKYELLSRINIGGMAEIVKARDTSPPGVRLVAIKRVLPHLSDDQQYKAMFLDESRVLAQLEHPSIIETFEIGEIDGVPYIALEYIHGQDARELLHGLRRDGHPLPIGLACYIAARVCEGLHHAHEQTDADGQLLGIVHRDVSLQNILLSYDGDVKLTDFGIAVSSENVARTEAGVVKGKFGYMSPEQIKGAALDRRSDVFAAGICLYELLTGERLFSGDNDYKAVERVRNADVEPPSARNRQIPSTLERIVMKALAKRPRDRYQTANDLRRALQAFMAESKELVDRASLGAYLGQMFAEDFAASEQERAAHREVIAAGDKVTAFHSAQQAFIDDAEQTIVAPSLFEDIASRQQLLPSEPAAKRPDPTGLHAFDNLAKVEQLQDERPPPNGRSDLPQPESASSYPPLDSGAPTPIPGRAGPRTPAPSVPSLIPSLSSIPLGNAGPDPFVAPRDDRSLSNRFDMDWEDEEPTTVQGGGFPEIPRLHQTPREDDTTQPRNGIDDSAARTAMRGRPMPRPAAAPTSVIARNRTETVELHRHPSLIGPAIVASVVGVAAIALLIFFARDRGIATLRIETDPADALVTIDGHRADATASPFLVTGISAGVAHTIVVEKPGYTSWSTRLRVRSGKVFPLPLVRLLPIEPLPAEPTTVTTAADQPAAVAAPSDVKPKSKSKPQRVSSVPREAQPTRAAVAPVASARTTVGTLRVNSRPWSRIKIDGTSFGNTPQMNLQVRPGSHILTLENPEFGIKKTFPITIKAGETVTRVVNLLP
jgi:serine/threonine protein kinase